MAFNFYLVLKDWYESYKRDLPWRHTQDPYFIWLSEVILQQTRVNQGMPYYFTFIEKFPTVADLAAASQDEVLATWAGLGYYSRARNLHKTAKMVMEDHAGQFPSSFKSLQLLVGIGPYTAAAIASFAFGEAVPVVDGNVLRVLSRYFGVQEPVNSEKSKAYFFSLAKTLIPTHDAATFNQAIMELGALVCLPKAAQCLSCPLQSNCWALANHSVDSLPVKTPKKPSRNRHFHYFIYHTDRGLYMKKREGKDIWEGLYDFPLLESSDGQNPTKDPKFLHNISTWHSSVKHILSHQNLWINFCSLDLTDSESNVLNQDPSVQFVEFGSLDAFAKPIVIKKYLENEFLPKLAAQF